jgi:hypothetical protein
MMEIVSAVIGVVLGFFLNELVNNLRKRAEKQQQFKSIKTLIQIEIDQNLAWLLQVSQRLAQEDQESNGTKEIHLPNFLGRMAMPLWSHKLWESQLPNVASALNPETIRKVHEFHSNLDKISEMALAINDNPKQFGYRNELYEQFVKLMNTLIKDGNPIG